MEEPPHTGRTRLVASPEVGSVNATAPVMNPSTEPLEAG